MYFTWRPYQPSVLGDGNPAEAKTAQNFCLCGDYILEQGAR